MHRSQCYHSDGLHQELPARAETGFGIRRFEDVTDRATSFSTILQVEGALRRNLINRFIAGHLPLRL